MHIFCSYYITRHFAYASYLSDIGNHPFANHAYYPVHNVIILFYVSRKKSLALRFVLRFIKTRLYLCCR